MKHHTHFWKIDSKGKGICIFPKCGNERQFKNYLEKSDTFRRYQPPTAEERKARHLDTMLNEFTWPVI